MDWLPCQCSVEPGAHLFHILEARLLLCAEGDETMVSASPIATIAAEVLPLRPKAMTAAAVIAAAASTTYPLSSVPRLSSRPASPFKLYLDFNGDPSDHHTPAYDQDGNPAGFSPGEIDSVTDIWSRVAEKYSPFNIDVTTIDPGSAPGTQRMLIGGKGEWTGGLYGGIAYIGSFSTSSSTTNWIFPGNLANGAPWYTAEAVAHEAGHGFGLLHQSTWVGNGIKLNEYDLGGDERAPIMGNSYYATRGIWWYGHSTSFTTYQDDLAVLASRHNRFGYAADDHASSAAQATSLGASGDGWSGAGVIQRAGDVDVFSLGTGGGRLTIALQVAPSGPTLDGRLTLSDARGNVIASGSTDSLSETLSASVGRGTYFVSVAGQGRYGDLGQYHLVATTGPEAELLEGASDVRAIPAAGGQVELSWRDNSFGESAFIVQRSIDAGAHWATLATLKPDSQGYHDAAALPAGGSALYRVVARSQGGLLQSSWNSAVAAGPPAVVSVKPAPISSVPAAPSKLTATGQLGGRILLSWSDNSKNESVFKIERSTDGRKWSQIATAGANTTRYTVSGLSAGVTYLFRVRAANAAGNSQFSNMASAKVPAGSIVKEIAVNHAPAVLSLLLFESGDFFTDREDSLALASPPLVP